MRGSGRATVAAIALCAVACARVLAGPMDQMTGAERERIWHEIEEARRGLALPKAGSRPSFQWPLRAAKGYADPGFDVIAYFVDHNSGFPNRVTDFHCGGRSYDLNTGYNHQGTDIALWPDAWNLMAAQQIEIIAAAPGTIVSKADGNFDRNCAFNNGADWNAVYVQHDDGSVAWYGHMKSGSLTRKAIGERVVAGEFLGNVGSSGQSTAPHLHFEVYDASGRLIDPFAGQCNTWNADSWWASQPAYSVTRVNAAMTASAVPTLDTCGANGRMQDPGNFHAKSAFRPGDTVYFVATVRDIQAGQAVTFTIRRPDGSVWRQVAGAPADQSYEASYWYQFYPLDATAPSGTWLLEAELSGTKAQAPFSVTASGVAAPNYTDLWWNPAESGWGVNVIHQGATLFATWFTYDADRSGMWLVMSDARAQPDGSYSGTIYRATGVPFSQINGAQAANLPLPAVGTGTFRFASAQQGTFAYTVNGVSQQKAISPMVFSARSTCTFTTGGRSSLTNYQDLWWNAAESGWGINLAHQGDILFATWFTYGAGGKGQWLFGSDVERQPTGEFRGRLYRSSGTSFSQVNGTPALVASGITDVGQIAIAFADGEHARMDYTLDGVTQSKQITRLVFASPVPLCR